MKTPEQEFLKALAVDLIDHKHFLKDEILNACKKYLASLEQNQYDITEKVEPEPAWKPEVGKLYRRTLNGVVTEITKLKSDRVLHTLQGFDYIENGYHEDYIIDFIKEYEPIAELEGLKVGDCVYSELGEAWSIDNIDVEVIVIIGQGLIDLDIKGVPYTFTNQQLFWRTADRAERFGRGVA